MISALKTAAAATDELDSKFSAKAAEIERQQEQREEEDAVILKDEYEIPDEQLGGEQDGQHEDELDGQGHGQCDEEGVVGGEVDDEEEEVEDEEEEQSPKDEFEGMGEEDEDSMDAMPLDVPDFSLISSILAGMIF